MGLFERITSIFKGRAERQVEPQEDPGAMMDVSLDKSQALMQRLERAMADVTAGRLRLDMQIEPLEQAAGKLEAHAREALGQGREDLARSALTRRSGLLAQIEAITAQRDALRAEHEKMSVTQQKLEARIEAFRTQKDTIQAQYSAAEAQAKVGEAVSGLSEDMADMGAAAAKAQDRLDTMQARAEAIDELIASGSLEDITVADAQLEAAAGEGRVDEDLERLKREIESTTGGTQTGGTR